MIYLLSERQVRKLEKNDIHGAKYLDIPSKPDERPVYVLQEDYEKVGEISFAAAWKL